MVMSSASVVPHFTLAWQKYMQDQPRERAEKFWKTDNYWLALLRDILVALLVVAVVISIVFAYTGSVTPLVAVESGSMEHHINIGDVVLTRQTDRVQVVTYAEGKAINYKSFGDYGDVIVYRPNGDPNATPIIHRAMSWVNAGDRLPNSTQTAPHAGYITKGDNNQEFDQPLLLGGTPPLEPVKPEWIIGVAQQPAIPWLGELRLALPSVVLVSDQHCGTQIFAAIDTFHSGACVSLANVSFATGAKLSLRLF
jgi:signal peptidase